jgi:cyclopropane fatty-acyl-phospholipid synthase-like methyltransferase
MTAFKAGYLYSAGPAKRLVRSELLDDLHLCGHEQVLDIGCGRGAVLILKGASAGSVV